MVDSTQSLVTTEEIANSLHSDLAFDSNGYIRYKGRVVAIILASDDFYLPSVALESSVFVEQKEDMAAIANLTSFLYKELGEQLQPIFNLKNADKLSEKAQKLADLLLANYGVIKRSAVVTDLQNLDQFERATLRQLGVRFGRFHVFLPHILKPGCIKILMMLFFLQHPEKGKDNSELILAQMLCGKTTIIRNVEIEDIFYKLSGYDIWNNYVIRVDITERLANYVQQALNWREGQDEKPQGAYNGCYFFVTPYVLSVLGVSYETGANIFKALGYVANRIDYNSEQTKDVVQIKPEVEGEPIKMDLWTFVNKSFNKNKVATPTKTKFKSEPKAKSKKTKSAPITYDSPFAVLLNLKKEL